MIPKPIDSEKKIWPKAAPHTPGSVSAPQSGVNRASRPLARPVEEQRLDHERARTPGTGSG